MNPTTDIIPRRHFLLGRLIGSLVLRLLGWRIEGDLPQLAKCVIAVAPHTSNWDFVIGMATALKLDLNANWLGKNTIFCPPFKPLLLWLGGIPVDRRKPQGIFEQVAAECNQRDHFLLAITPEGTRRPVTNWKTGCYRIAKTAGIPVVATTLDYSTKTIRFFEPYHPGDDVDLEMRKLSEMFPPEFAKIAENFTTHK
jgi:1-acyl-sn-glycerol-3-phosphate acyltransferase